MGGIEQFGHHLRPLMARQLARRIIQIRKARIFFRRQRAIFHHGKRSHVIIVHVALGRIGDLDKVRKRMKAPPLVGGRVAGNRAAGIDAWCPVRHPAIAQVVDVSLHGRDHHILRHQLQVGQSPLHLLEIAGGHRLIRLVGQADLVGVRNRHRKSFARAVRDHRPMVGGFELDFLFHGFVAVLDRDDFLANLHVAPFAVVTVLARLVRIQFFLENIGGIRPARRHRNRTKAAMAQTRQRSSQDRHPASIEIPGVNPHLVKAKLAIPA